MKQPWELKKRVARRFNCFGGLRLAYGLAVKKTQPAIILYQLLDLRRGKVPQFCARVTAES